MAPWTPKATRKPSFCTALETADHRLHIGASFLGVGSPFSRTLKGKPKEKNKFGFFPSNDTPIYGTARDVRALWGNVGKNRGLVRAPHFVSFAPGELTELHVEGIPKAAHKLHEAAPGSERGLSFWRDCNMAVSQNQWNPILG